MKQISIITGTFENLPCDSSGGVTSTRMSRCVTSAKLSAGGDFTSSSLNLKRRYTPKKINAEPSYPNSANPLIPGGRGRGDSAYERGGDARRKF